MGHAVSLEVGVEDDSHYFLKTFTILGTFFFQQNNRVGEKYVRDIYQLHFLFT